MALAGWAGTGLSGALRTTECGEDSMLGGYNVAGRNAKITKTVALPAHKRVTL